MEKALISAIVLCKNGQRTLQQCLQSLSFVSEVILADDGSTDASREIASKFGARIRTLSYTDSFAAKRNEALSYALHDWVLFIDSDEVVSATLAQHIKKATTQINYVGFYIQRTDVFLGRFLRFGETGNTWLLRLAHKSAFLPSGGWQRMVHEVWKIQGNTGKLNGPLLHYPHTSIKRIIEKINRYTDLEVKERKKTTNKWIPFLQMLVYPPGKFLYTYILKLGFLDGFPGFVMSYCMSLHSLCVRIKLLETH